MYNFVFSYISCKNKLRLRKILCLNSDSAQDLIYDLWAILFYTMGGCYLLRPVKVHARDTGKYFKNLYIIKNILSCHFHRKLSGISLHE